MPFCWIRKLREDYKMLITRGAVYACLDWVGSFQSDPFTVVHGAPITI